MQTISSSLVKWLQGKQQDFEIHARFTVEMFGEKRWCFTTCALFMLCLRGSYVDASLYHKRFNKLRTYTLYYGKIFTPRGPLDIGSDKGLNLRLEEAEPGFDFNEEEMKKLKIWPGGAIPYYIDEFSFDKVFRDRIRNFLDMTNSMTGLNFLELHRPPGDDETRWVFFVNRQGVLDCIDHPFKNFTNEGVQKILLGYDCLSNGGELAKVVLALVGVPPQHNAPNRNKYIEIIKPNIMPGKTYLFEVLKDNEWLFHEVNYDFASAGHYNLHKYTVNGMVTIKPLDPVQKVTIGEGKGFSYTDIWKIRMIYNYISKKRLKSMNMPACNKLFDINSNNSGPAHDSGEDIQPRKKPNKYLGLPEPELLTDNKEKNNITETNTVSPDKKATEEEIAEETSPVNGQVTENKSNNPDDSKENNNKDISKDKDKSEEIVEKHNEDMVDENSSPQSNSKDDDEARPQGLKFTRPGKKSY